MVRPLLALAASLLMTACQSQPADTPASRIPIAIPAPTLDLQAITLPQQLGALELTGSAMTERAEARMFFYQLPDGGENARVVIYAFPGGWEDMAPLQVIGGHYGQARQQELARLQRRGYGTIEGRDEGLYVSDSLTYPVAEVLLLPEDRAANPSVVLMVAAAKPAFVRLVRETRSSSPEDILADARDDIVRLVEAVTNSLRSP